MYLDPSSYTMADVAGRVHRFLFSEKSMPAGGTANILLRVCGYSAGLCQRFGKFSFRAVSINCFWFIRKPISG